MSDEAPEMKVVRIDQGSHERLQILARADRRGLGDEVEHLIERELALRGLQEEPGVVAPESTVPADSPAGR
jgi:hypothetical protein